MANYDINNVKDLYINGIAALNDNPLRLRSDANHALAFGNSGTYNVGVDGPFLVGYRGGALGSSDPTFNDKSFAWSYSNLVAYKPLNMCNNAITNLSSIYFTQGAAITTNAATWTTGSLTTLIGDVIGGDKYIKWSYDNNPGTLINDNHSINITAPTTILSNTGDCDLYGGGRVRLYAPNINIEDTTGNIINFGSNVYDSFTNIGDQRIKYGTVSGSNIFTIRNISGDIDLEGSNVTRTLSGVQIGQPVLQYGEATSSGNNGSVVVTLPTAYTSAASYVAFVSMMDADPAEMSVVRNTSSEIEIFWAQAGGGSHTVAWNTMGT
jgi:hypothetical protein